MPRKNDAGWRFSALRFLLLNLCCVLGLFARSAGASNAGEVELTREGRAAIDQALQFLANNQRADGSFTGELGNTTAIVAAGVMGWMCAGNLPGEGPYGKNVAKGVDYILNCANPDGLLIKKGADDGHAMYHHGLATLCLSEAYGQTRDKRIGTALKKAVDLLVRGQNNNGGWHYLPNAKTQDLSVVVMQTMALRAARDAGIAVPKDTIDRAMACVEHMRTPKDAEGISGFAYQGGDKPGYAMTAAGVASLLFCGDRKAADLKEPLDYLVRGRARKEDQQVNWPYAHYYGMIAMYRAGSQGGKFLDYWKKWYSDVSKEVIAKQTKSGANRGQFALGSGIWSTGMCILMLGVPYRYLPIYQR